MNEKLKKWEGRISEKFTRIGKGGRAVPSDTLISITTAGNNGKVPDSIMRISFNERLLGLTGWKDGDCLDMEISGDEAVVFRSDVGRQLCKSTGSNTTRRYLRYASAAGSFCGFPVGICRQVEAGPGKVAFLLPVQSV